MARLPRLAVSGYVHHVMVSGNNSQSVFFDDEDRHHFVELISELAKAWRVAVHAYVLLDAQIHLLVTPQSELGLPKLMQGLGRRYASAFNRKHSRSGTLWEGRYRSTIIEPSDKLLECMVWMDGLPVRAHLVDHAPEHVWGSCRHYLGLISQGFITSHPQAWILGNTPFAREAAYAMRLERGLTLETMVDWDQKSRQGWVVGSPAFVEELQKFTPRRLTRSKPGRPVKKASHANT